MMDEMLSVERFGEIVDDYIRRNHVVMVVETQPDSGEWSYEANIAGGPTIELFIALQVFRVAFRRLADQLDGLLEVEKIPELGNDIVELIRSEITKEAERYLKEHAAKTEGEDHGEGV